MSFTISNTPGKSFQLLSEFGPFGGYCTVSLAKSVSDQTGGRVDTLTNARALEVFRNIERQSKVLSFLTKPVVLLSVFSLGLAASFSIPVAPVASLIVHTVGVTFFAALLAITIHNSFFSTSLTDLSDAFSTQANAARQAAAAVENSREQLAFQLEQFTPPARAPLTTEVDADGQISLRFRG